VLAIDNAYNDLRALKLQRLNKCLCPFTTL